MNETKRKLLIPINILLILIFFISFFSLSHAKTNDKVTEDEVQFTLAPNPIMNGQEIHISVDFGNSDIDFLQIFIYDQDGNIYEKHENILIGKSQRTFKKSLLMKQKGLYFIKIQSQSNMNHICFSKVKKLYVL